MRGKMIAAVLAGLWLAFSGPAGAAGFGPEDRGRRAAFHPDGRRADLPLSGSGACEDR